jgi:hypothetical protein
MTGTGGFLVPGFAERPLGSITDFTLSNGEQGYFVFDDIITGSVIFGFPNSSPFGVPSSLVTWSATQVSPVSTPEPSVFLMLVVGLAGCAGLLRRLA